MEHKEVYDRMIDMEITSQKSPNLLVTYEVMWNNLKKEIQENKEK